MTTFYLVRHGAKQDRTSGDAPWIAHGIAQAQATAEHFAQEQVTAIYASPLRRAAETLEQVSFAE